ncbi:MAG: cytochrome c biogenesis protein ResB [Deltaproteobacteria bacterium]|nr:cytochrome c biogenesis protein ResB [Deltaproteobacteria bacterium]MBI4796004.1 cytochrome c biogenesis protein ResB [Deltaproteobacteria bacterium]
MSASSSDIRLFSWLGRQLTSIRLTVFLLLILAVVAVVGTVAFPGIYYQSWFLAPLGLLALNLLACLVEGLPQAVKKVARPFTGEMALALPERGRFTWPGDAEAATLAQEALRRELGRPRREIIDEKEVFFYRRGRLRPLGPYIVHLALVLILAGGVVGKFWGIEGRVLLQPELPVSSINLEGPQKTLPLAFQVRLDRFQVLYYEEGGGTPKEFRSDLTFFQDGEEKARAVCRVNEPVTFGGYTFYQSSYGAMPQGAIPVQVSRGNKRQVLELFLRRWVRLPESEFQFMAVRVEANLQGHGPAVQLAYRSGSAHPQVFWLLQKQPELAEPHGAFRLALGPLNLQYYSVLQVKQDPGVWWVYLGFILILPGLYLAFFRPSQRWAVVLKKGKGGRWEGRLLGASPRGRETFAAHTERLLARLQGGAS